MSNLTEWFSSIPVGEKQQPLPSGKSTSLSARWAQMPPPEPVQPLPPAPQSYTERFAQNAASLPEPQVKNVPFGSWAPDQPTFNNEGSTECLNVIPTRHGVAPFKTFGANSDALSARPLGAAAVGDSQGNVSIYAGDTTKLYRLIGGTTWSDISGSTYATPTDGNWEFAVYNDKVIATNFVDPVQSVTAGAGGNFADHITSTSKPKARHVDVVGDFLVLGYTDDATDGVRANRVWWSGIGSSQINDFDISATTQSDFNDTPDLGSVQRIVGGVEYGLVFYERGIERMTYVGSPQIFRFDRIDRKRGTPIPNSVIAHGRRVFFWSEEGFMVSHGTGDSQSIGHWGVDKKFSDQYNASYKSRVSTAIDNVNKLVMWGFRGDNHTANDPSEIFIFNWQENRWSHVQVDHRLLLRSLNPGTDLEGLDAFSATLENLEFSLDSDAWKGGDFQLAAFDTSNQYGLFDGVNMAATVDTMEAQCTPGRFSRVTNAWPIVDGGAPTVAIDSRIRKMNAKTAGSDVSMETAGNCPQNVSSRYHTAQFKMPAGETWSHAQGVELEYVPEGVFG